MNEIFAALAMMAKWLPIVVQLVQAAEGVIPGDGKGEQKLQLVLSSIEAAGKAANQTAEQVQELKAPLAELVGGVVQTFNTFKNWPAGSGD